MAHLRVAGKIVEEVSQNVPSTKFAIIELIKNAYESGAKHVEITVSSKEIDILDDGCGMNIDDINTLLTLSNSKKVFGQLSHERLTSGEKGLGFFSAFKFGNIIEVETFNKSKRNSFSLDLQKINKQNDLSNMEVQIHSTDLDGPKGTNIKISDLNHETFRLFKKELDRKSEFEKLTHVIKDKEFSISIIRTWETEEDTEENSEIIKKLENAKIAEIKFDSKEKKEKGYTICLNYNGSSYKIPVDSKYNKLLNLKDLSVKIKVNIYSLKGTSKKIIPMIFHTDPGDRIVPLMYINHSLFDNYTMYNPEINTAINNTFVFRQQTGAIEFNIYSPNIINFNADRTQIIESENKELINGFLDFVSSESQKKMGKIKSSKKNGILVKSDTKKRKNQQKNIKMIKSLKISEDYKDIYVGEDIDPNDLKNVIQILDENGNEHKSILNNKIGNWTIEYKNGNKLYLNIQDVPNPQVKQLINKFDVGRTYLFDEVFDIKDYLGGTRIKPLKFEVFPKNNVIVDTRHQNLVFSKSTEIKFNLVIKDKISNKVLEGGYEGRSYHKDSQGSVPTSNDNPIYPLFFIKQRVKSDVLDFKNQLNNLYRKDDYDLIFVSSIRTFVELVIDDITSTLNHEVSDKLSDNLKYILKNDQINDKFLNKLTGRDGDGTRSIYDTYKSDLSMLLNKLNIMTHSGQRLLNKKQLEDIYPQINLLYTYLCFLNKDL